MVQIIEHTNQPGFRFWFYAPVSSQEKDNPRNPNRDAIRAQYLADRKKIGEFCYKPIRYGFKARIAAYNEARKIEQKTGVEMVIGRHDYI